VCVPSFKTLRELSLHVHFLSFGDDKWGETPRRTHGCAPTMFICGNVVGASCARPIFAMATMNVSLPDQMKSWVEECVQSGRYSNASDYVRDLIRRDHMQLERLRQALIEGENSGPATAMDIDSFVADKKRSLSL